MLPGLVDAHNHLALTYKEEPENNVYYLTYVLDGTPLRAIQAVSNGIQMLNAGFTIVRDMGNAGNYADAELRQVIEQGWIPRATIINSGILLVTPAPRADHQYVVTNLVTRLANYLARYPVGQVLLSPADISWAPDVLVQPDVFVVAIEEARTLDRFTERRVYQEFGVPWYWMVDIEGRAVEVWTPEVSLPAIERERLVWQSQGAVEPLMIPLADILPPV